MVFLLLVFVARFIIFQFTVAVIILAKIRRVLDLLLDTVQQGRVVIFIDHNGAACILLGYPLPS
jgi:hypothetical protein